MPSSWYPDTTPSDLEKWKVPSCVPCNTEHGKNEQWLLIMFGLCLDPKDPASSGIYGKAMRSIDPASGRNARDAHQRLKLRQKVLRKLKIFTKEPTEGVFPNFGLQGPARAEMLAVPLDAKGLRKLTEKMVRGVVYVENAEFIDENYEFVISFMKNEDANFLLKIAEAGGGVIHRGPGISVTRAYLPSDKRVGVFVIEIWQRARFYAVCTPKEMADEVAQELENEGVIFSRGG
jgi:hypothetical protein